MQSEEVEVKLYQFVLALLIGLVGGAYLGTIATQERTRTVVHRLTVTAPRPPLTYIPPESSITPEGARQLPPAKGLTLTAPSRLVTPAVLELLEQEEGYDRCAYLDPFALVWTVGFGQTHLQGGRVPPGFCFANESAAVGNLKYAVEHEGYLAAVVAVVGTRQSAGVYTGEISFDYNLGSGIYTGSLRADLERHDYRAACAIQRQYDHVNGVVLADLERRRVRECDAILAQPPKPPTHAQVMARWHRELEVHYRLREALERDLAREACLHRPKARYGAVCGRWRAHLRVEQAIILAFHGKGVY
jgi:GH24 family phage-related lysozyme (muramidase)